LEAMASGRPVVCTNTPGSLMITDGLDGYKTNVGDVEMMTDRILKLLLDHELTLKMADSARRKVENDHDWVKISEQYYNLYTSLA
jgi:L-malate glycosyltransferase